MPLCYSYRNNDSVEKSGLWHTQTRPSQPPRKKPRISPGVTLAFWRLRQTWRLLLVTGIGIVAAVTFVCTVPFYSDVTTTIGLRDVLASSAQNTEIAVQSASQRLDTATINKATQRLQGIMQRDMDRISLPCIFD